MVDLIDVGAGANGTLLFTTAGDASMCYIDLDAPAFGGAVAGVATLLGVPHTTTDAAPVGGGTVTKGKWKDKDANIEWTDVVGVGSGEIQLSSNVLAEGDKITITAYTFTAG